MIERQSTTTHGNQQGFSAVEALLILVIVGILGFTGWFVWHAQQSADKTLNSADKTAQTATPKLTAVKTFADCKKAAGSVMQESYPETCVTKSGKRFTDTASQKYLLIKEWGIEMPLSNTISDAYYVLRDGDIALGLTSLTAKASTCSAENLAQGYVAKQTAAEHDQNVASNKTVAPDEYPLPVYPNKLGGYYYAYVHPQQGCTNDEEIGNLQDMVDNAFSQAIKSIQSVN